MSDALLPQDDHDHTLSPQPDTPEARMARMHAEIEAFVGQAYQERKAEQEAQQQRQLWLLEPLEGLDMEQVLAALIKLNALEQVAQQLTDAKNAVYALLKENGFPEKTVRAALKIAKAMLKRDASEAVLERCVALALSLMAEEEKEIIARPHPGNMLGSRPSSEES